MMRKSTWLLSAALVAVPTPRFPSRHRRTPTRHQPQPASPTEGSRPAGRPRRATAAGRHRQYHHHRAGPPPGRCRTCRSRSPRSAADDAAEYRRHRHPPAQPARAVAAGLLDRHRSERLRRAYPRHRHGRRQSRPRKLGRGVHRRRLSLAHRHRPQRARRARPDRGAARPAGHVVRPQRVGRPDHIITKPSRSFTPGLRRSDLRQLRLRRLAGGVTGPISDTSPRGSTASM